MSVELMASELVEKIKAHIDEKLRPILSRLDQVEAKDFSDAIKSAVDAIEIPKAEDGKDGKDGVTAEELKPVLEQMVAAAVSTIEPPAGKDGEPGKDGEKGDSGRDALDIDVLPEIVEEKSYPYGTYAKHKGGLWKSVNTTRGMRGWECIVDGVDVIDIDYDGERGVTVTVSKSSGDPVTKSFDLPAVLDRGTFRDGTEYKRFDAVTFAGSLWIAQEDTAGKPGIDKSWRLSVKRGRNAVEKVKQ